MQTNYSLISIDMPLISNLNMIENIALIKEVIFRMSTKNAQEIAEKSLQAIELSNIALFRIQECSDLEIFYVMFIRALMSREKNIIISSPYLIIKELIDINKLVEKIDILNKDKEIIILDTQSNSMHYKGCLCNTIK